MASTVMAQNHRCLVRFAPRPRAAVSLFCFAHAGGRASMFRAWQAAFPSWLDAIGLERPGRGSRLGESLDAPFDAIVAEAAAAIAATGVSRFALYGHSLGAVLAFDVARRLQHAAGLAAAHLFVAARRAPHLADTDPTVFDKPDAEIIGKLEALAGTPKEVLADPDLLQAVLPGVRADFRLSETYTYTAGVQLRCPVTACGGEDDPETQGDRLPAWRDVTSGPFASHVLPGGHFFAQTHAGRLRHLIAQELAVGAAF